MIIFVKSSSCNIVDHIGNMIDKKVLIIDDDVDFLYLAGQLFTKAGAQVSTARGGLEGVDKLFTDDPGLIILDVIMPEVNGFETCQRIRQFSDIPVIMLSASNSEEAMLQGLEFGADDFLTKPFSPKVLLARAHTVMRRPGTNYQFNNGRISLDLASRQVLSDEKIVQLSPIELRLLAFLIRNSGKLLTFDYILANVWGSEYRGDHTRVSYYIWRLRTKIEEDAQSPLHILSVYGVGYIFER